MTWTQTGGNFQDPPVGTHIMRCIRLIDLGTQKRVWEGKESFARQNVIGWELPTELITEGDSAGKPFIVHKFYTTSLSPKANLYGDLVNWRGQEFTPEELEGFEEKNLLDKTCLGSLTKNDKGKVRLTAVIKAGRNMTCPARVNDLLYFSLEPERFDRTVYDSLSQGFKDMIARSPEFAELNGKGPAVVRGAVHTGTVDDADDIPFASADSSFDMVGKLARRLSRGW